MLKKNDNLSDENTKKCNGEDAGQPEETIDCEKSASEGEQQESDIQAEPAIEDKLANCEEKIAALIDQNLRQMAEFDNYRKHSLKEKAELIRNAAANVLTKILPVIDDFERAIQNNGNSNDIDAIREGTKLIYSKLMHILESEGLKRIPAKGEKFDTDFHEAIAIAPATEENPKDTIIDCTRQGYMLNDKVLRTSQVVVAN